MTGVVVVVVAAKQKLPATTAATSATIAAHTSTPSALRAPPAHAHPPVLAPATSAAVAAVVTLVAVPLVHRPGGYAAHYVRRTFMAAPVVSVCATLAVVSTHAGRRVNHSGHRLGAFVFCSRGGVAARCRPRGHSLGRPVRHRQPRGWGAAALRRYAPL